MNILQFLPAFRSRRTSNKKPVNSPKNDNASLKVDIPTKIENHFKLRIIDAFPNCNQEGHTFVKYEYTTNNGFSWNTIKHCEPPFCNSLQYDYEYKDLMDSIGNCDSRKKQFSSYEKVKQFQDFEYQKCLDRQDAHKQARVKVKKEREDAIKRANE